MEEDWELKIIDNDTSTYVNKKTGEVCEQTFKSGFYVQEGWAAVTTHDGKNTFFNPSTKELCSENFEDTFTDVHDGWTAVKVGNAFTFYNLNTKEFCGQKFPEVLTMPDGFLVPTEKGWAFYNIELNLTFQSTFQDQPIDEWYHSDAPGRFVSMKTCLKEHPEDFALLSTAKFRDTQQIEKYLDAAAEGVKARCPVQGTTEEVEEFANKMKTLIANKIKTEKENIRRIEAEKAREEDNKILAAKAADEIKNLRSLLNDEREI